MFGVGVLKVDLQRSLKSFDPSNRFFMVGHQIKPKASPNMKLPPPPCRPPIMAFSRWFAAMEFHRTKQFESCSACFVLVLPDLSHVCCPLLTTFSWISYDVKSFPRYKDICKCVLCPLVFSSSNFFSFPSYAHRHTGEALCARGRDNCGSSCTVTFNPWQHGKVGTLSC